MKLNKKFVDGCFSFGVLHRVECNYDDLVFLASLNQDYFFEWKNKNLEKFYKIMDDRIEKIKDNFRNEFDLKDNFDLIFFLIPEYENIKVKFNFLNTDYCTSLFYESDCVYSLHKNLEKDLRHILYKLKPQPKIFEKIKKLLTNK